MFYKHFSGPYYVFQILYLPGRHILWQLSTSCIVVRVLAGVFRQLPETYSDEFFRGTFLQSPPTSTNHLCTENTLCSLSVNTQGERSLGCILRGGNMHTTLSQEDLIFWFAIGKIYAQMKPEEDQMQNEIIEQKDSGFSDTPSFSVTLCCPVTCTGKSSRIKCQQYHLQPCCWHAFAIPLKIPLIFWLHNSWATPHLNIQKSILFKAN